VSLEVWPSSRPATYSNFAIQDLLIILLAPHSTICVLEIFTSVIKQVNEVSCMKYQACFCGRQAAFRAMLCYFLKVVELRKRKWKNQVIPGSRSGQRPDDISVGSVAPRCDAVHIDNIRIGSASVCQCMPHLRYHRARNSALPFLQFRVGVNNQLHAPPTLRLR
jgi:hypothetical protein